MGFLGLPGGWIVFKISSTDSAYKASFVSGLIPAKAKEMTVEEFIEKLRKLFNKQDANLAELFKCKQCREKILYKYCRI